MSTTPNERRGSTSLDFEVLKEPWNLYHVSDGSKLRIRIVLKDVRRVVKGNVPEYFPTAYVMIVVICAPELKGTPSIPSSEEVKKGAERTDISFETIALENNDYLLSDGTRIKMYFNIDEISRTSLYDANGDRIYKIDHFVTRKIKLAPQYSEQ
ncbi:MAG: hypothetical protein OXU37_05425 [Thaumarchaeota archaeon]|nr:hypothetical protein [Nitrososphaerota archaeon]